MKNKKFYNFQTRKSLFVFVLLTFLAGFFYFPIPLKAEEVTDFDLYQKYDLCLKYEKKEKYSKYKKYSKNKKKYGFSDSGEKGKAKDAYNKYKLYKKDPKKYPQYAQYESLYKKYVKYKKYVTPYSKYSRYKNYKEYDRSEYNAGKNYCGAEYLAGYNRYQAALAHLSATVGEADLVAGALGPDISVGIHQYTSSSLGSDYIRFKANKSYVVKNANNETLATEEGTSVTKVKYNSGGNLKFYNSANVSFSSGATVYFEAADGNNDDLVMSIEQTDNDEDEFDQYRGKLKVHYTNSSNIWVINTLPMEHYVWGMGEIRGTGDTDHNRVMTTIFRTYGYWKVKFSTKYAAYGFKVTADSSSQVYYGYDWETDYPRIKEAAEDTVGVLMMYANVSTGLNEVTISPYSSWTDGRTRSFQERWGSTLYPWCQSVLDSYGKNSVLNHDQLYYGCCPSDDSACRSTYPNRVLDCPSPYERYSGGNHMVGLSANGSLSLATDHDKDWQYILNYYFTGINLRKAYPYPAP